MALKSRQIDNNARYAPAVALGAADGSDRKEWRTLLEKIDLEAEPLVRALCLLPLPPGAAQNLNVGEFDRRTGELTNGKDKASHDGRILIPDAAARLLGALQGQAAEGADLHGQRPAVGHGLVEVPDQRRGESRQPSAATTAYALHHSTITDFVTAGLPLLTIAQISGPSAAIMERHYGHLMGEAPREALARLAL